MKVTITSEQLFLLTPNMRSSYRDALLGSQDIIDKYMISENPLRVAHFFAQLLHETRGGAIYFENLNYSAKGLVKVWPSRFKPKGELDPEEYAHKPEKIANAVYGGRMGNSDVGDGFKYRGRGLLQLTGKDGYKEATSFLQNQYPHCPDFRQLPDEVVTTNWCVKVAVARWEIKNCNVHADQDKIDSVTRRINGGLNGLSDRKEWLRRTKNVWLA